MKPITTRAAQIGAALIFATTVPVAATAGDLPEIPSEPLSLTCADLGVPEQGCNPDIVTEDWIRAMLVAGPLTRAAMAPLVDAQVFGAAGALPAPPEVAPPAEGEMPPMFVPVFDVEAYREMMAAGVHRTVVVEDLDLEVSVPVIDCRFAICLPAGLTGGPGFVDWVQVEMPEMPPMPEAHEAPAAE